MKDRLEIIHHGGGEGVTGSCHELRLGTDFGILVDCGLFQGSETSGKGASDSPEIDFEIAHIRALVVTHVHLDHVGRIPYLLAAGYEGPIYCSEPSALLLPLVIEDAVKVGVSRDRGLVSRVLKRLKGQVVPLPYGRWQEVGSGLSVKLKPAGHILGSAYVECRICATGPRPDRRVVFSGDLGAPYSPLLPAPRSPYRADVLVLESTYGDRIHEDRRARRATLKRVIERALRDRGVILIPAFSIGRTQELLYELEELIHAGANTAAARDLPWNELEIVVDSPLASRFTEVYRQLKLYWDNEAHRKLRSGRHPLSFEQLTTVDAHADHLGTVRYLQKTARPCVVLAASGMCSGGRIVNYLEALIGDKRTDIVFVGYQARGTCGRAIQQYGPQGGYVDLPNGRQTIAAGVHTISGYSAHADQANLLSFVKRMRHRPAMVRLVHGDAAAKQELARRLSEVNCDATGQPLCLSI